MFDNYSANQRVNVNAVSGSLSKTYTTDVLPTTEPLKAIEVSVLYQGIKETKWIDCTYKTDILLSFPMQVHGYFSHKGDKINIKRVLKWKYR